MTKELIARFTDGHLADEQEVKVRRVAGGIEIRSPADGLLIAFWRSEDLRREAPGVLRCETDKGARLVLPEPSKKAAAQPAAKANPRRRRGAAGSRFMAWLIILGTLGGGGLLAFPTLAEMAAQRLPPAAERHLGDLMAAAIETRHGTCAGPAGDAVLQMLSARLGATLPLADRPRRVVVVRDHRAAVQALPGGIVLLTKGMLDRAQSPDEVVGLLARAMAQVAGHTPAAALFRAAPIEATRALATRTPPAIDPEVLLTGYTADDDMAAERGAGRLLSQSGLIGQGPVRLPSLDPDQWAGLKRMCG
jgi:hypothetical protein